MGPMPNYKGPRGERKKNNIAPPQEGVHKNRQHLPLLRGEDAVFARVHAPGGQQKNGQHLPLLKGEDAAVTGTCPRRPAKRTAFPPFEWGKCCDNGYVPPSASKTDSISPF